MYQQPQEQKRNYFRLEYPKKERPVIQIGDIDYEVTEISEQGIRILSTNECDFALTQPISGFLHFHDDKIISIEGFVLRIYDGEIILKLSAGPNLKHIKAEEIRIRKRYPMFFDILSSV